MKLHILKTYSIICIMFLCITSCATKSIYTNPCELVEEKKVIPKAYKLLVKKKLIPKNILVSDSLVYSDVSDFREVLYPLPSDFKNVKQIRNKHDSLYSLSIRRKEYKKDCSIKSLLKNKETYQNSKFKIYFSKLQDNFIMAEVFDFKYDLRYPVKYRKHIDHTGAGYYGNTMRYLFLIEKNKIKKMYSMSWRYGI